jgi:hypothetical protein
MAASPGPGRISRRFLVKLTGSAMATAGLGVARLRGAIAKTERTPQRRTMLLYELDPEWGAGDAGCPAAAAGAHAASHACHACTACHGHAMHKQWATADCVRRAHVGCRCEIRSRAVSVGEYRRRFGVAGTPSFHCEFDDRW